MNEVNDDSKIVEQKDQRFQKKEESWTLNSFVGSIVTLNDSLSFVFCDFSFYCSGITNNRKIPFFSDENPLSITKQFSSNKKVWHNVGKIWMKCLGIL